MSKTDAQFQQWLETSGNYRCALIRLTFLGAAVGSPAGPQEYHAYVSNMAYVTRATDTPANQEYDQCVVDAPAITSRMAEQLEGRSQQSYGDLMLSNEFVLDDEGQVLSGAVRDSWLSMNWDGREYEMYVGDPSWPFADFRLHQRGTIVDVYDAGGYKLGFHLSDKGPLLDRPVMTSLITSGPRAGDLMPLALGHKIFNLSPKLIDDVNLIYQITAVDAGGLVEDLFTDHNDWYERPADVREDGVSLALGNSITAVDVGTDTFTTTTDHGYTENTRVYFANQFGSALPTGITASPFGSARTYYWVIAAGLTSTDFRVSATRGGSVLNITGSLTGTPFIGAFKWDYLGDGTFQLCQAPAGTITCDVHGLAVAGLENYTAADIIQQVLTSGLTNTPFTIADIDTASFAAFKTLCPQKLGVYLTEQTTFAELLDKIVLSVGGWWGFSDAGLLQLGRLDLPSAGTPDYSFIDDDVARRSMKFSRRILPRAEVKLSGVKNWTQQQTVAGDVTTLLRATYAAPGVTKTGAAAITTWDTDPANHIRAVRADVLTTFLVDETELQTEADRVATMQQYPTATKSFQTHQGAILLGIGSLIETDTARSAEYGTIVGLTKRIKGRSEVEFFAALADYYPTADIT